MKSHIQKLKFAGLLMGSSAMFLAPAVHSEESKDGAGKPKKTHVAKGRIDVDVKAHPVQQGMQKVPFLGIYSSRVSPTLTHQLGFPLGFYLAIEQVEPGSPAELAGLQQHDILQKVDDQKLVNPEQLRELIRARKSGDIVELTYFRGGKVLTSKVKLVEHQIPAEEPTIDGLLQKDAPLSFPWNSNKKQMFTLPQNIREQLKKQGLDLDALQKNGNTRSFSFVLPDGKGFDGKGLNDQIREQLKKMGIDPKVLQGQGNVHSFNFNWPDANGGGIVQGDDDANVSTRTSVFSSDQRHFTVNDDHGSLSLIINDGKGDLVVRDKSGKTLYQGPYTPGMQLKELSGHWQKRLRELDSQKFESSNGPTKLRQKRQATRDQALDRLNAFRQWNQRRGKRETEPAPKLKAGPMKEGKPRTANVRVTNPAANVITLYGFSEAEGHWTQPFILGKDAALLLDGESASLEKVVPDATVIFWVHPDDTSTITWMEVGTKDVKPKED